MRVILVPVADRPECRIALDHAFHLADDLTANVVGCHLRPHRSEDSPPSGPRFRLRVGRAAPLPARQGAREADLKCRNARDLFMRHVKEHGYRAVKRPRLGKQRCAQWIELVGAVDRLFCIAGPIADMSVVSRPKQNARGPGPEILLSALLHSGKPVLVLPQTPAPLSGQRILVAWNQSVEAARAVSAALPLLRKASAVHICSCGPENSLGPKAVHLAQYLTYWGVESRRLITRGSDVPGELEATCSDTDSDLVVMGAYSRNRMREIVFGGVTQHMLFRTARSVFALHS